MKTKDIMKILKLVKKSRKHKKRKRYHSKKKVLITPTQNIPPSALQPYEINRNTNNLGVDNLRLNNTLLENKIKDGSELKTQINDINNKLVLYDTNTKNFNTRVDDVNQRLLGYDSNNQVFSNLITDVNQKLLGYDHSNKAFNNMIVDVNSKLSKQEYDNRLSSQFVNTSISRMQNYNKNLDDRIDDIWRKGPQLINDVIDRKFTSPQITDSKNIKIDGSDDDTSPNIPQDPPNKPSDPSQDTPLEPPPNIRQPTLRKRIKPNPPPDTPPDTPTVQQLDTSVESIQKPIKLKSKKKIKAGSKLESYTNFEADIKGALDELDGITTTDLDKEQLKKYGTILNKYKIQYGSNTKKKARVIQLLKTALDKK